LLKSGFPAEDLRQMKKKRFVGATLAVALSRRTIKDGINYIGISLVFCHHFPGRPQGSPLQPAIVDIPFPPHVPQETLILNYDFNDGLKGYDFHFRNPQKCKKPALAR